VQFLHTRRPMHSVFKENLLPGSGVFPCRGLARGLLFYTGFAL